MRNQDDAVVAIDTVSVVAVVAVKEQVDSEGKPVQLKVGVDVNPPRRPKLIVPVPVCPGDRIVMLRVLGLSVKSWMLRAVPGEFEEASVVSPGYLASTLYPPPAMVALVKVAVPDEVVAAPSVEPESVSMKVTVSPLGGAGAIVAVKVTLVPTLTVA